MRRAAVLSLSLSFSLTLSTFAPRARADGPYFVFKDDGTAAAPTLTDPDLIQKNVLAQYDASGLPRPDVLSVWTTFPMGGSDVETIFDPDTAQVSGINVDKLTSSYSPMLSMLLHNDVLALASRAKLQNAPLDGFADYLFLLELSHNWGPAINVPANADAGVGGGDLIGFPYHWSFWLDAGRSPAGGNAWHDNGDGTFTAAGQSPGAVAYSMLDLYLMGMADPSEVMPFGVLEGAIAPSSAKDPLWGGVVAAHSFPWFSATPLTVTATRRTLTIDDVIARNGPRMPAAASAPRTFTVAFVVLVKSSATDADVAQAKAAFDPIAPTFAPAFHTATQGRGTLTVLSLADAGADAGADAESDAGADSGAAAAAGAVTDAGGCSVSAGPTSPGLSGLLALFLLARRRR